jgi:hypothetical protein
LKGGGMTKETGKKGSSLKVSESWFRNKILYQRIILMKKRSANPPIIF